MADLLLVEDDDFLREALRDFLVAAGHSVVAAPDGAVAKDLLDGQKYDLVITDIKMPKLDGTDLLAWAKKSQNESPFIIMTGFSHLLETQTAYSLGASEFLVKPFKNFELTGAISRVLNPQGQEAVSKERVSRDETLYCQIAIDDIVTHPVIKTDVYIKLPGGKYICIGRAGSELSIDRIAAYKAKGVQILHVRKEDFSIYES